MDDGLFKEKLVKEMSFDELKEALKYVRRLLLTIIIDRSGERLKELQPILKKTTILIDENIALMLSKDSQVEEKTQAALHEIKEIWGAFQKTRDEEILPALREGRFDDAIKLASGVQEERYRQFISIAELVDFSQSLENMLEQKTKDIRNNIFVFVRLFTDLMELFDSHLGGHCKRVSVMAKSLAEKVGLERKDVDLIEAASNLHTIGLIGVPRVVFHTEEKDLNKREKALLRNSPVLAQELLSSIDILKQAGVIIRGHMERYDGTGYPDGLKGEEIHIGARILAVCKFYDTLRYRTNHPLHRQDAIEHLKSESGHMLDPNVVDSFVQFIEVWTKDKLLHRVPITELKSGMLLASDLATIRGTLLVPEGTRLTSQNIKKIVEIDELDPIVMAAMVTFED